MSYKDKMNHPFGTHIKRPSQSETRTLAVVTDIFGGKFDEDVIRLILEDCNWKEAEAIEKLCQLASDDRPAPAESQPIGLDIIACGLLDSSFEAPPARKEEEDPSPAHGHESLQPPAHTLSLAPVTSAPGYSAFAPVTSALAPGSSAFAPVTSALTPRSSDFAPVTSAFTPRSSDFAPVTSAFAPVTDAFAHMTSALAPVTSASHAHTSPSDGKLPGEQKLPNGLCSLTYDYDELFQTANLSFLSPDTTVVSGFVSADNFLLPSGLPSSEVGQTSDKPDDLARDKQSSLSVSRVEGARTAATASTTAVSTGTDKNLALVSARVSNNQPTTYNHGLLVGGKCDAVSPSVGDPIASLSASVSGSSGPSLAADALVGAAVTTPVVSSSQSQTSRSPLPQAKQAKRFEPGSSFLSQRGSAIEVEANSQKHFDMALSAAAPEFRPKYTLPPGMGGPLCPPPQPQFYAPRFAAGQNRPTPRNVAFNRFQGHNLFLNPSNQTSGFVLRNAATPPPLRFSSVAARPAVHSVRAKASAVPHTYDDDSEPKNPGVEKIERCTHDGSKLLVIMRGLPGSGKSYLAKQIKGSGQVFSTDEFFMHGTDYEFSPEKLPDAHAWNKKRVQKALDEGVTPIIVDNTNVMMWEMLPYGQMAQTRGYTVEVLQSNTPWSFQPKRLAKLNTHGVPLESIKRMKERYETIDTNALMAHLEKTQQKRQESAVQTPALTKANASASVAQREKQPPVKQRPTAPLSLQKNAATPQANNGGRHSKKKSQKEWLSIRDSCLNLLREGAKDEEIEAMMMLAKLTDSEIVDIKKCLKGVGNNNNNVNFKTNKTDLKGSAGSKHVAAQRVSQHLNSFKAKDINASKVNKSDQPLKIADNKTSSVTTKHNKSPSDSLSMKAPAPKRPIKSQQPIPAVGGRKQDVCDVTSAPDAVCTEPVNAADIESAWEQPKPQRKDRAPRTPRTSESERQSPEGNSSLANHREAADAESAVPPHENAVSEITRNVKSEENDNLAIKSERENTEENDNPAARCKEADVEGTASPPENSLLGTLQPEAAAVEKHVSGEGEGREKTDDTDAADRDDGEGRERTDDIDDADSDEKSVDTVSVVKARISVDEGGKESSVSSVSTDPDDSSDTTAKEEMENVADDSDMMAQAETENVFLPQDEQASEQVCTNTVSQVQTSLAKTNLTEKRGEKPSERQVLTGEEETPSSTHSGTADTESSDPVQKQSSPLSQPRSVSPGETDNQQSKEPSPVQKKSSPLAQPRSVSPEETDNQQSKEPSPVQKKSSPLAQPRPVSPLETNDQQCQKSSTDSVVLVTYSSSDEENRGEPETPGAEESLADTSSSLDPKSASLRGSVTFLEKQLGYRASEENSESSCPPSPRRKVRRKKHKEPVGPFLDDDVKEQLGYEWKSFKPENQIPDTPSDAFDEEDEESGELSSTSGPKAEFSSSSTQTEGRDFGVLLKGVVSLNDYRIVVARDGYVGVDNAAAIPRVKGQGHKLRLDKSTTVDITQQPSADWLYSCFPGVAAAHLNEVLEVCNGEVDVAVELMFEWGISTPITPQDKRQLSREMAKHRTQSSSQQQQAETTRDDSNRSSLTSPPTLYDLCVGLVPHSDAIQQRIIASSEQRLARIQRTESQRIRSISLDEVATGMDLPDALSLSAFSSSTSASTIPHTGSVGGYDRLLFPSAYSSTSSSSSSSAQRGNAGGYAVSESPLSERLKESLDSVGGGQSAAVTREERTGDGAQTEGTAASFARSASAARDSAARSGGLVLSLPPALVHSLEQMFGVLPIPDKGSASPQAVSLDLSTAQQLYQCLARSLSARPDAQADAQRLKQLREDAALAQYLQEEEEVDRTLAAISMATTLPSKPTPLSSPKQHRQHFSGIDVQVHGPYVPPALYRPAARSHPVNLQDIMDEEMLKQQKHERQVELLEATGDHIAIATKLKREKLHQHFPGIDERFLEEIFQANGYILETTVRVIAGALGGKQAVPHRLEMPAARDTLDLGIDMELAKQQSLREMGGAVGEQFQRVDAWDSEDADYQELRQEALLHYNMRRDCLTKAHEAHRRNMGEVASFYSRNAHLHFSQMKEANTRASEKMLEMRTPKVDQEMTLDLHGFHVDEAMAALQRVIEEKENDYQRSPAYKRQYLSVITGQGKHSQYKAKIRPVVKEFLDSAGYRYQEKPGMFKVTLLSCSKRS